MAIIKTNGVEIYYEFTGNGKSGETVVFLNGVMASANSWAYQTPVFRKTGFNILLHDFRGQTKSEKPSGPYTFDDHVEDLKALLDSLNLKKIHIIGTSYGGEVGMYFALAYPEYVKSLSLIDSVSEIDASIKWFVDLWKTLAEKNLPGDFFRGMMPTIYSNSFLEKNSAFLEQRAKDFESTGEDYFRGQINLYNCFLGLDITDRLHMIRCPVLIICGEKDILKPVKFSEIIHREIPQSEFVIIPDCGHVTIFEKPDELNSLLLGFTVKNN